MWIYTALTFVFLTRAIYCEEAKHNSSNIYMPKCCQKDESFIFPHCVKKNLTSDVKLDSTNTTFNNIGFETYQPECHFGLYKLPKGYWLLTEDLQLNMLDIDSSNISQYCVDSEDVQITRDNMDVFICIVTPYYRSFTELIFKTLSCVLFMITIFLYNLPFLKRRHGKCTVCYLICLGTAMFICCITLIQYDNRFFGNTILNTILGYLMLYAFICNFVWLSVIVFDVAKAISSISDCNGHYAKCAQGKTKGNVNSEDYEENGDCDKKKFQLYCLISFGSPLILITMIFICDFITYIPIQYRPNIDNYSGWFTNYVSLDKRPYVVKGYGEIVYLMTSVTIPFITTIVLLSQTTIKFRKMFHYERTKLFDYNPDYNALKSYNEQVILNWCLLLSIVIPNFGRGVVDILEYFELFSIHYARFYYFSRFVYYLYVTEGLIIFFLLVLCRGKVVARLLQCIRSRLTRTPQILDAIEMT